MTNGLNLGWPNIVLFKEAGQVAALNCGDQITKQGHVVLERGPAQ